MNKNAKAEPSSFRDPGNSIYSVNNVIYRQINESYYPQFQQLVTSGLYQRLVTAGHLVPHEVVSLDYAKDSSAKVVIRPEKIDFISYPYEWCYSQIKEAALLTLEINRIAIGYGMILKDASGFNIQFHKGRAVLIDTGSFEFYAEDQPWLAYNQFCKHFFAPLALMNKTDLSLNRILAVFIDGIPLELASKLLPLKSWFTFPLLVHIHLHAKSLKKYSNLSNVDTKKIKVSKLGLYFLCRSQSAI